MADIQRRAQDTISRSTTSDRNRNVIKNQANDFLSDIDKYNSLINGTSPCYLIYYQLDKDNSTYDKTLENVHSYFKNNSPKKYKKIYDVPVWGVDVLDVVNNYVEYGFTTQVNGSNMIFKPNTVEPMTDDFFVFDYDGMETHLFKINEVQYDKITPKKYYNVSYAIYPNNADEILNNISGEYSCNFDATKTDGDSSVVSIDELNTTTEAKELYDAILEKYNKQYFDVDLNVYRYNDNGTVYWSPYLQHFLAQSKIYKSYSDDFMTEIYLLDIDEYDNPEIFNEETYGNSLYRNIEIQNKNIEFSSNFMTISPYRLKGTRNLPFYLSPDEYKLLAPISGDYEKDPMRYLNAFPLFFRKYTKEVFSDVDHYHKVHIMDNNHLQRLEPYIKDKEIVYECKNHELEPTQIYMTLEKTDYTGSYKELEDISIITLINSNVDLSQYDELYFLSIIKDYLNGTFTVSTSVIDKLRNMYLTKTMENYLLIPIILYIIKKSI